MEECKLKKLKNDLLRLWGDAEVFQFTEGESFMLVRRIEENVLLIVRQIAEGRPPRYEIPLENGRSRLIDFSRAASKDRFAVVTFLLSKIMELVASRKSSTKREIFYENVGYFQSQREVERALYDVAQLLNTPMWQLRIHGTSKGLIAGNLRFLQDGKVMSIDEDKGSLIPQNVMQMRNLTSSAKWILLIEKDAAFQRCIQDGILSRLGPCLLITGKGFPDVNTRMLVRRLWEELKIPILAVVDADPYGIDIMCVYRFGSSAMSSHSSELACPAVRWLGVHPTDIERLSIEHQPLSQKDNKTLQKMLMKPCISQNERLTEQVEFLLRTNSKAEMEGLCRFSSSYMTDNYIPSKLRCGEYI